ncbi:hypothetical protein I2W78_19625 [Streptomyces spinoverrucosus]|uniref:hypothetical protein n=1 Tax=Streptomyces spinoverrucosus TaxID=284043 RepID=UPI0018C40811|nr:hypothetical protein [Streptomyces spinoverrucosus]MBG0853997.1 hypothetical protein [Streptomyces spinoverrucosus]
MWFLYSGCVAVVLSVAIRLFVGRTSIGSPLRDPASLAAGVPAAIAVFAAAGAAGVESHIALGAALLWFTAAITSAHSIRESLRSHS